MPSGCQPFGSAIVSGNAPFASATGTETAASAATSSKRRMELLSSFPGLYPLTGVSPSRFSAARRATRILGRVVLYDSPVSGNCYKVRLLLAHLGIEVERRAVDVVNRTDRGFLDELNPAKRVPTLILEDGRPLAESNAILWYFGEGTRFVPDDAYERAQVLQWM